MKDSHVLLHCISLDCAMSAGIARSINATFPKMQNELLRTIKQAGVSGPMAMYYAQDNNAVINMVTKENYWDKPSYINFEKTLKDVVDICKHYNITKLAMPKIGCGLDKLDWRIVYHLIETEFAGLDIEITICHI